jgi:hypothetical protein
VPALAGGAALQVVGEFGRSSASPGGQPSITQPMAGPCDSPNVVTVNSLPNELELTGAAPPVR